MKSKTRSGLALLQKYETADLTTSATRVDGRGKGSSLYLNLTTALAIERRGFGVITEDDPAWIAITDEGRAEEALGGKK
jgi:hypothetical protein